MTRLERCDLPAKIEPIDKWRLHSVVATHDGACPSLRRRMRGLERRYVPVEIDPVDERRLRTLVAYLRILEELMSRDRRCDLPSRRLEAEGWCFDATKGF